MPTEAIRRIRQVFSVEGAERVIAANQRVAQSQQGIASTAATSERATLSLERQFGNIERRYNATIRAEQDYERVQRQVNAAVAQNPALQERGNAVLKAAEEQYKRLTAQNDNFTRSQGLARHELVNLSRQAQDVFVSLASGQRPMTVLIQQGTQIGDVFANSTGTLRGFLTQIRAMISPTLLLVGGIAALGVGAYTAFSSWKSFALQLDDTARTAGTTTQEMAQLQAAASFKGIGQEDFASGIKSFAASVYEARSGAGDLFKLFRGNGQMVGDAAQTLERVADLIMRARDDQQRLQLLQQAGLPATLDWVRLLRGGADGLRQAKDQAVAFGGAANDEMVRKAREFDEAWNRAWTNFGLYARNAAVQAGDLLSRLSGTIRGGLVGVFGGFDVGQEMLKRGQGTPLSRDVNSLYGGIGVFGDPSGRGAPTIDPRAEENRRRLASEALQMEQQRLQLLGDLATAGDRLRLVEIGIAQARMQPGNKITDEDVRRIREYAEAEIRLTQQREAVGILGGAATETERYAVRVGELNLALRSGKISQEQFNRALLDANPIFATLKSSSEDFVATLIDGFARGEDMAQSLSSALNSLSSQLIRMGSQQVVGGLLQGLSGGGQQAGGGLIGGLLHGLGGLGGGAVATGQGYNDTGGITGGGAGGIGGILGGVGGLLSMIPGVGTLAGGALAIGGGLLAGFLGQNQAKKQQQQQAMQAQLQAQQQAAQEAAQRAQQQADAAAGYRYQASSLGIDTGTQAGALARLELDIQRGRAEAAKTGGEAVVAYEELAQAQRLQLEKEWAEKIAALKLSYEDRIFAATNDNTTLAGKLADYDRKAAQERADSIKTYGQVYVELERAQAAERGKIIKDALKEQTDYYDGLRRTISDFTTGLQFGNLSTLSPAEQFLAARNQFQTQLGLAQGGDRTAQGGITNVAQTLLEQARNYLGPSVEYGSLVDRITQQLGALPDIAMAADPQVQELQRISDAGALTVDALSAISDQLEQTQAENRALQQQVASLIASGNEQSKRIADLTDKLRLELRQGLEAIKIRAA